MRRFFCAYFPVLQSALLLSPLSSQKQLTSIHLISLPPPIPSSAQRALFHEPRQTPHDTHDVFNDDGTPLYSNPKVSTHSAPYTQNRSPSPSHTAHTISAPSNSSSLVPSGHQSHAASSHVSRVPSNHHTPRDGGDDFSNHTDGNQQPLQGNHNHIYPSASIPSPAPTHSLVHATALPQTTAFSSAPPPASIPPPTPVSTSVPAPISSPAAAPVPVRPISNPPANLPPATSQSVPSDTRYACFNCLPDLPSLPNSKPESNPEPHSPSFIDKIRHRMSGGDPPSEMKSVDQEHPKVAFFSLAKSLMCLVCVTSQVLFYR